MAAVSNSPIVFNEDYLIRLNDQLNKNKTLPTSHPEKILPNSEFQLKIINRLNFVKNQISQIDFPKNEDLKIRVIYKIDTLTKKSIKIIEKKLTKLKSREELILSTIKENRKALKVIAERLASTINQCQEIQNRIEDAHQTIEDDTLPEANRQAKISKLDYLSMAMEQTKKESEQFTQQLEIAKNYRLDLKQKVNKLSNKILWNENAIKAIQAPFTSSSLSGMNKVLIKLT